MPACKQCSEAFEITPEDLAFYEKVSPVFHGKKEPIPPPTLCPDCRVQRRLAHINERRLYRRTSSKTGKDIISALSPDKPHVVYAPAEWWGDDWDPLSYGRGFDASRPFSSQLSDLLLVVPQLSLVVDGNENSDYAHYSGWDKNCYLAFCTDHSQDCMYTHSMYYSRNVLDCFSCTSLELCYQCVHCKDSYRLHHSQNCSNCSDSAFLFDCIQCRDCFGCTGLRNKQYCFFNEQLTKEAYAERLKEFPLSSHAAVLAAQDRFGTLRDRQVRRAVIGLHNEEAIGDYLFSCKNVSDCFDCTDLQDSKYCNSLRGGSDCHDVSHWGHPAELCYESMGVGEGALHILFSECCWPNCTNLLYCSNCISCQDCFGCVGLKHKRYCILNKQYSKEEYEALVPTIIESMRQTEEWGEFLSVKLSPFCYNETMAADYFPLTKEEVKRNGWNWSEYQSPQPIVDRVVQAQTLPDDIASVPDDILQWAVECEVTGKRFRILKQELQFYRHEGIALPRHHPDTRHDVRFASQNPRRLWERPCQNCGKQMHTSYAPDRPEKVWCEGCYLSSVY
jgi:hypothetical protein